MLTDSPAWHSISTRSAASSRRITASPVSPWCAPTAPRTRRWSTRGCSTTRAPPSRSSGYVTYGKVKLRNLRDRPATSILWRAGWQWAGVEGPSELIGPGDTDAESLRLLLRAVFTACGGTHDDWDTYDRVMREEGRVAVLVTPTRVYGNA